MLFSPKTKGFFVEQNDHSILLARTSGWTAPLVLEELCECAVGDQAALDEALKRLQPKKAPSGFLNAKCGVYPPHRLVRCSTLELKRLKEPGYINEVLSTQLRVEPEKFLVHVLNAPTGSDFDLTKATQKEALFCGIPTEDAAAVQDDLLAKGLFPERLELGTVATLGGLVDYLAFQKSTTPTLLLELGAEFTHSFIVTAQGVQASRPLPHGLESMIPVVQKELGLKDLESARKLFFSNTFDFTGMGPALIKRLLKELQSSIGFYEVQTGQSVGQVVCTGTPQKLAWLDGVMAAALGVPLLKLDLVPWLQSRQVTVADSAKAAGFDDRWFGLVCLMVSHLNPDVPAAQKKA